MRLRKGFELPSVITLATLFLGPATATEASQRSRPVFTLTRWGGKSTSVKGYYRKDGTYVRPHTRHMGPPHSHKTTSYGAGSFTKHKRWPATGSRRAQAKKNAFRKSHPCPSTGKTKGPCPGWEVDHIVPLACGGLDDPANMQWLTKEANRRKGAAGCRRR